MYPDVGTKEPFSLHMNNEGRQRRYPADKHTNGIDIAKKPLAMAVMERKFGHARLHHPGREDGRPRLRNSAARSGSGKMFDYL